MDAWISGVLSVLFGLNVKMFVFLWCARGAALCAVSGVVWVFCKLELFT